MLKLVRGSSQKGLFQQFFGLFSQDHLQNSLKLHSNVRFCVPDSLARSIRTNHFDEGWPEKKHAVQSLTFGLGCNEQMRLERLSVIVTLLPIPECVTVTADFCAQLMHRGAILEGRITGKLQTGERCFRFRAPKGVGSFLSRNIPKTACTFRERQLFPKVL